MGSWHTCPEEVVAAEAAAAAACLHIPQDIAQGNRHHRPPVGPLVAAHSPVEIPEAGLAAVA